MQRLNNLPEASSPRLNMKRPPAKAMKVALLSEGQLFGEEDILHL